MYLKEFQKKKEIKARPKTQILILSPHLLVLATNEQRVLALVATSGSHWLKQF